MKRIYCLILAIITIVITSHVNAVPFNNVAEAKEYLTNHSVSNLEGLFFVCIYNADMNIRYRYYIVHLDDNKYVTQQVLWNNWDGRGKYPTIDDMLNANLSRVLDSNVFSPIDDYTLKIVSLQDNQPYILKSIEQCPKKWESNHMFAIKWFPSCNGIGNASSSSKINSTPSTWTGSGFALNNGYVVTNYHVAGDAKTIRIKGINGDLSKTYSAVLVASDKQNDIAILKIQDSSFNGFGSIPYSLKMKTLDVGESVWALGYPMTSIMGEEIKFTDGKISARSGVEGLISLYQISVPIQPGNSGGALFDSNGNIVGITSSGLNRELNTENVNYAIKVSYLNLLIESMLDTNIIPEGTALRGQSLTTQIKLAKKYVFLIECAK